MRDQSNSFFQFRDSLFSRFVHGTRSKVSIDKFMLNLFLPYMDPVTREKKNNIYNFNIAFCNESSVPLNLSSVANRDYYL